MIQKVKVIFFIITDLLGREASSVEIAFPSHSFLCQTSDIIALCMYFDMYLNCID